MLPNGDERRLIHALLSGWGFKDLKLAEDDVNRTSVWTSGPDTDQWTCHKVSPGPNWLGRLLDEAGVPSLQTMIDAERDAHA
jgi:hypothetical protein